VTHDDRLAPSISFTLLHDVPTLVQMLTAQPREDSPPSVDASVDVRAILRAIHAWLGDSARLYERRSGRALDCVALVRVAEGGERVLEVLHHVP
jgi:hypothetical protein